MVTEDERVAKLLAGHYQKGVQEERERIIKLIKQDIEFQSSKLKHDFESDKAIEWRLTGMKFMIKKINQGDVLKNK